MTVSLRDKLDAIEKFYLSASAAAEAAGVTLTSWGRWKNPNGVIPSGPRLKLIELLYEQATSEPAKASNDS